MPQVSITRLRVRSRRFLPIFFIYTVRSAWQARSAAGNLSVELLRDPHDVFWTKTLWTDEHAMKSFMVGGIHRRAMPHLLEWCDEAALVGWSQDRAEPPTWQEAHRRMLASGRTSKVHHPSPAQSAFTIPAPASEHGLRLK